MKPSSINWIKAYCHGSTTVDRPSDAQISAQAKLHVPLHTGPLPAPVGAFSAAVHFIQNERDDTVWSSLNVNSGSLLKNGTCIKQYNGAQSGVVIVHTLLMSYRRTYCTDFSRADSAAYMQKGCSRAVSDSIVCAYSQSLHVQST